MKAYLEISVEKELPKDDNMYAFVSGNAIVGIFPKLASEELLKNSFDYYLKPFSLPELMEEYMCHIGDNYQYVLLNGVPHYRKLRSTDYGYFKPKELFNDFLIQKGIIEESGPDWDALNDFPNKAF